MKKVLLILGIVVSVGIGGFIAILAFAHAAGSAKQEAFFEAVGSGDPAKVMALIHPAVRDQIDEPVLAEWMRAFNENLGAFKGLSSSNFSTSTKMTDDGNVTESEGTVNFENGSARSQLAFLDGKITDFKVESEALPDDWFEGPSDRTFYHDRGEQMLRLFLAGDAAGTFAMFHESYQEIYPLAEVEADAARATAALEPVQSIEARSDDYTETGPAQRLKALYAVTGANRTAEATVTFRFVGLKGHIVEFMMR